MDKPIFSVCVYNCPKGVYGATADIDLPATEYELEDALQKVRDGEGGETLVSVESFGDFPFLRYHIGEAEDLRALNALAEKLAALEPWQIDAFEGLVRMDEKASVEIDLPRLYDLASSVDGCLVLYDVRSYEELGRFYAENFIPNLEELPDEIWELLDFRKIGEREEARNFGILLDNDRGFVARPDEEITQAFRSLDLTPKTPDYTALLEVSDPDSEQATLLKLPSDRSTINKVRMQIGAEDWSDLSWCCVDCLVPELRDAFSREDNIGYANYAAKQLQDLPKSELLAYKALIGAAVCAYLPCAMKLMGDMDSYVFTRSYTQPEDVALAELSRLLDDDDAAAMRPFVNLRGYGEKLMEAQNISLTPYGGIKRKDGEPIEVNTLTQNENGMEMTM